MLTIDTTLLVVIDVQEKLLRVIHEKEKLVENLQKLIRGARVLEVPVIVTEQNPAGLGLTVPEIAQLMPQVKPVTKFSFSCCGEEGFLQELKALNRKQVLLTGIETHVCVYQTAVELVNAGYEVQIAADCVSSRTPFNRDIGINRMSAAGASITSVETALFELLRVAKGDKFKEISRIVK
jgi:nicotinamidase-related amidase